jgi:hypothetical protein
MKWILVWWIVNPGHPQETHFERGFASEEACTARGAQLQVRVGNRLVRWHCSWE